MISDYQHLIGNDSIKTCLVKAVQKGHLHHTLLMSGPDGIGKFQFARALARRLLETPMERVESERHPDLHILRPDGKSGTHLVEQIRRMIDEMHKPPFESKRKVFIIQDAERLQLVAANMLLKTLEEPDIDAQIIMISSAPDGILPTIVSRSVRLNFQPIPKDSMIRFLCKKHSIDEERAKKLAQLCNGSLSDAIALLQNGLKEQIGQTLIEALEQRLPSLTAVEQIEKRLDKVEGIDLYRMAEHLIKVYLMWVRDCELLRVQGNPEFLYFADRRPVSSRSLAQAEVHASLAHMALERNMKLSTCLDFLLN
jgi:DNA polymerase-3 subunit delta'